MKNRINQRRRALAGCGLLLPLFLAALLPACSRSKAEPSSGAVVETNTDPNVFTMENPGQFPLTTVEGRKVSDEIHVNGVIAPDVNRSVPVVSLGGGRVVEIKAKLGDTVRKGQVLLLINSPDLSAAFSDYQKFKADAQLANKQLERAKLLYDKGAIALADVENAEDVNAKAIADLNAAMQRVHVLGGDVNTPSPLLPLRAPIAGVIVDQQTTGGTGVRSLDNQQALFTIADLSVVWVLCDAYQDMLPRVHVGDIAEINLNGVRRGFSRQSNQHQPGAGPGDANCKGSNRVAQSTRHPARGNVRDGHVSRQPSGGAGGRSGVGRGSFA